MSAVLLGGAQAEGQAGQGAGPALDALSDPIYVNGHARAVALGS